MDTLGIKQAQSEAIVQAIGQGESTGFSLLFWAAPSAVIIAAAIAWYFVRRRRKGDQMLSDFSRDKLREIRKKQVDMDGLLMSINQARDLYKLLSRKCHPDLFIHSDKHAAAEALFQEITRNKRNYSKLTALKKRAVEELDINLKN